jgi:predicted TIM-barrel fold metal-dependent hydrolase
MGHEVRKPLRFVGIIEKPSRYKEKLAERKLKRAVKKLEHAVGDKIQLYDLTKPVAPNVETKAAETSAKKTTEQAEEDAFNDLK